MRTRLILAAIVIAIGVAAIGAIRFFGAPPSVVTAVTTPAPSPEPSPSPLGAPVLSPSPGASPSPVDTSPPTPTPQPTPSTDANLLAMTNGAFVRRWTAAGTQENPQSLAQNGGIAIVPRFTHPVEFVFELPSAAHVDRVAVTLRGTKPAHVDVAFSVDARTYRPIGTAGVALPADVEKETIVEAGAAARFVRFTVHHEPNAELRVVHVAAYGTPGPPQRGALTGTWMGTDVVAGAAEFPGTLQPKGSYDPRIVLEQDGVLSTFQCTYRSAAWNAPVSQNVARFGAERLQLAGNGNLLVGFANGHYLTALRSKKPAPACEPVSSGKGPTVLALVRVVADVAPQLDPATFPGYRFERRMAPLLEAAQLAHAQFAVLNSVCNASTDLAARRQRILLQWVAAGHKLIIRDADDCGTSDYSFLPFRFSTIATGAGGARGEVLALADPSTLGSGPGDPAHVLDVDAYLTAKGQQIGDADIMKTDDPRWCGHLFATNRRGASGWVHAYARYGRGLIIYDGFDRDDLNAAIPAAKRVVQLEYAQPALAELPCNARVASGLVLYPSVDRTLPAGKPAVLRVPMRVAFATKEDTPQEIALSIAGDERFRASVSPAQARLAPGAGAPVIATVELAKGWSGAHAFTVTAAGRPGLSAQAAIRIDGSVGLLEAFESARRVRIYGIHFDVDSAKIQPLSEVTIAQIAQVLAAHPDWTMRVEGHTDSDGGAPYNKSLSVRRAEAVVSDLVARYHVARGRLTSAGFGLTRPVASNATEAGKALNRRVELVRL
jgi:outer membrane protein OmpA-like peptidoglycan-associated protein